MINFFQKRPRKEPKRDVASSSAKGTGAGASSSSTIKKKAKTAAAVGDEGGSKKRKQKKKKDPNAPKKAMSGYMFFLQNEREVCSVPLLYCVVIGLCWWLVYLFIKFLVSENEEE